MALTTSLQKGSIMSYANVPSAPSGFFTSHLSLLRGWFFRGLPYLDLTTPRATYVMRSILAAWLALVVAYWLDLRAPYAAASSVLLVINPVQGAVIGKGAWRIGQSLIWSIPCCGPLWMDI